MYPEINSTWNDDNCGRKLGYICKIPHDGYVHNPESVHNVKPSNISGHCEPDWTQAGVITILQ